MWCFGHMLLFFAFPYKSLPCSWWRANVKNTIYILEFVVASSSIFRNGGRGDYDF